MDEGTRLALACALAPAVAWVMWIKIARPLGRRLLSLLPPGRLRDALAKDRGGYL